MDTAYPFGMRECVVTPFTDDTVETEGTPIPLPAGRTVSWTEAEEFDTLRGNDTNITTRGLGPSVSWELEGGGYNSDVVAAIFGGTVVVTGISPDEVTTLQKKSTDQRPWFKLEGRAISDNSGDVHVVLYRCKATGDFEGEFSDGNWFLTNASGEAFPSKSAGATDALYDIVYNETAAAII